MTPTVQGETLVYLQDEQEQELTVGTPAWFAWLETASTFSFVSEEASSPLDMSDQASIAEVGTGKPTANSTASSPLTTWASLRHSRLSAYGP